MEHQRFGKEESLYHLEKLTKIFSGNVHKYILWDFYQLCSESISRKTFYKTSPNIFLQKKNIWKQSSKGSTKFSLKCFFLKKKAYKLSNISRCS